MNNKISLLPHNQKLFNEIMDLIKNGEHSIFYSEATGLGKSFIFMSLVNELFKGKKVLYIVPKIAIWENMNMYKEFEYIKDYVEMTTYADFNSTKIRHYDYDAIFIDECHHLASDIQGANIVELCKEYVEAERYVFGFTATPENGKKKVISDIYFNSKVYGMNIIEAIESGIFNKIEYAIADHDTVVDDEKYCKKYSIDGTKTLLENIISERKDITRWLVYFSNIAALNNNLESVIRLFPDFKLFVMHSKNDYNDEQLKEFNSYEGKCMLLTVSMILEGIHPKNVGGILLYRNIGNNTTFLQVLGRVCDTNIKISPLCVDITKSIHNIKKSHIRKYLGNNKITKRSIKNIIDVKASSYKYVDLICNLRNAFTKEYRGYSWNTDVELCKLLGMSNAYVGYYRKKGLTYEEIIDQTIDKKYNYRGYSWNTDKELTRLLNVHKDYICKMKNNGLSYEEIIDQTIDKKYNYRGYSWNTDKELSRLLGMSDGYVNSHCKRKGLSYEEIIDKFLEDKKYNYGGYSWNTDVELCKLLGVSKSYISYHKNKGLTYNQIIDKIMEFTAKSKSYRGYSWKSNQELCRLLGVNKCYVSYYRKKGLTYEQIIDQVLEDKKYNYRGYSWSSDAELSRLLGMCESYVGRNKNRGLTCEQIIDQVLDNESKNI